MPPRSQPGPQFGRIRAQTRRMINGEEGVATEYKESAETVDQDALISLANAGGGTILVGVREQRQNGRQFGVIVGCDTGENARRKLFLKARACMPPLDIGVVVEGSGNRKIMRLDVKEAPHKPCCTNSGTYKVRRGTTTFPIDPELMTALILERESKEFLARFKAAGKTILDALNDVAESLENKIDEVRDMAENAAAAAEDAANK